MYLPRASMFIPRTKRGHGAAHGIVPSDASPLDKERATRHSCELCRHLQGEKRDKAHFDPKGNRETWESEHKVAFPRDIL